MSKALFDAVRQIKGAALTQADVDALNAVLSPALAAPGKRVSKAGTDLIHSFESCKLTAYPDPATGGEPVTIGWGHTGGVPLGLTITEEQADKFLRDDLARFETFVSKAAPKANQNQFDALVSLAFNIGTANLKTSTLLRMHNAGDYAGARKQFLRWSNANGKRMAGLVRRREAEAKLYGEPC